MIMVVIVLRTYIQYIFTCICTLPCIISRVGEIIVIACIVVIQKYIYTCIHALYVYLHGFKYLYIDTYIHTYIHAHNAGWEVTLKYCGQDTIIRRCMYVLYVVIVTCW